MKEMKENEKNEKNERNERKEKGEREKALVISRCHSASGVASQNEGVILICYSLLLKNSFQKFGI
jgi:hypothetical protein